MKRLLVLPVLALALVACKNTATSTTAADKVVGKSPSFSGNKNLTESMIAEGKELYDTRCAKCHDLPKPADFNDEKWVGIMNAMAPKAKLSKEQSETVYNYVTFKN